jgi:hypothetical protein
MNANEMRGEKSGVLRLEVICNSALENRIMATLILFLQP